MKYHHNPIPMRSLLLLCCLATAYPAANAEETDTSTTTATTTSTAVGTSQTTETKLVAEFSGFLGGDEQAKTIISGLRQGTSFDLVTETTTTETTTNTTTGETTTTTSTATTTATIEPPTGTMGYGNIRIALRLSQTELAKLGITEATPEQLSAILVGGDINGTQVTGILSMRADGMGWGQIAKSYDTTVGQLMGKGAGLTKQTASASQTKSNGYIPSGKPAGSGVINGMGGSMGSPDKGRGLENKAAKAQSVGNSGVGKSISMAQVSNAGGGGSATAPGQLKKN